MSPTTRTGVTEAKRDGYEIRVAALRARLERQSEMLIGLLSAMGEAGARDEAGSVADHLFRLLGIVTLWQASKNPSEADIVRVGKCLDSVQITKKRSP